jgi:DNA-binding CsgD family transcriptional regulator
VCVVTEAARERYRGKLALLSRSSAALSELRLEAIGLLKGVVGFQRWCWSVGDPDSLLGGGDLAEADLWPVMPRIFALEQWDEVSATHVLARRKHPVGNLDGATCGELALNQCWDECLRPFGIGDQATVVLRDAFGTWGYIKLWRDRDEMAFAAEELRLLEDVAPYLGSAMRRQVTHVQHAAAGADISAAVLVLGAELRVRSMTASAQAWLARLPGGAMARSRGYLPQSIYAAAARAMAASCPAVSDLPARLRVRTVDGAWAVIEAAPLQGSGDDATAVTVRGAGSGEVLDLVCRAHGLTARERDVIELVFAGLSTRSIAERLSISTYTVQDHVKAIFIKLGVRSRLELFGAF